MLRDKEVTLRGGSCGVVKVTLAGRRCLGDESHFELRKLQGGLQGGLAHGG